MPRRMQYPVRTEPPRQPIITIDEWFAPLSQPTRKPVVHASQQKAHFAPNSYFGPEIILLPEWFAPLSLPVRRPDSRHAYQTQSRSLVFPFSVAAETITLDKWFSPLSLPVRRPAQRLDGSQAQVFPFTGTAETITLDKWFVSFSTPVRRQNVNPALIQSYGHVALQTDDPNSEMLDRWYQPLSQPQIRVQGRQQAPTTWTPFTPVNTEVVTVDKWFTSFSVPVRSRRSNSQESPYFVPRVTPPEVITADKWFTPLSQPVRDRARPVDGRIGPSWFMTTTIPISLPDFDFTGLVAVHKFGISDTTVKKAFNIKDIKKL